MSRILVVEDDRVLRELLSAHLKQEGYDVIAAADGESGLDLARAETPDLCVFDVMLPKLDGLSLCRILRRESDTPIIMLTARASEVDRVIGLDSGADDYVVKPFSLPELSARVRAALRRVPKPEQPSALSHGALRLELAARRVYRDEHEIKMTHKEFDLLAVLLRNKGAVLTRAYLLSQVWGDDYDGDPRTIDVHVRWLREKIEDDPSQPQLLQTVRGVGYRVD
jgi:DNA-binding response OmpR family regulator